MATFTGFSEEDQQRIKSGETRPTNGPQHNIIDITSNKPLKYAYLTKNKNKNIQLKNINLRKHISDDNIDEMTFEKCRLSIKTNNDTLRDEPNETTDDNQGNNQNDNEQENNHNNYDQENNHNVNDLDSNEDLNLQGDYIKNEVVDEFANYIVRKVSTDVTPDIVRGVDLTDDEMAAHRGKIEELQLKQKLMEEQNKKRKEMLSKALADRTRQTEEEVLKLEKIKKELQVLDGQFSQDVNVLRKKIDQACLTYSEVEKHYLKVEKEFLQAKIQLQKEKEKKELLTEHLCALITHNETRKAQKLETLMLELASNKKIDEINYNGNDDKEEYSIVVDGVDERTGKMVEMNDS